MDRRGQTQVVESILLVMITVALWTMIWVWFYPSYTGMVQGLTRQLSYYEFSLKERIVIEYVNYTGSTLDVYLTNTGEVELYIGSIYVNNTLVWSGSEKLNVDDFKQIEVNGYALGGEVLVVKVCSLRGNCWEVVERV